MVGVGEVLAITGLVLQVVAAVDKVILLFDRAQNAPDELRDFRRSLSRLQNNVNLLKAELQISGSHLGPQNGLDEVEDTLELCRALFVNYHMEQGSSGTSLRAFWSPRMSARLERYQKLIESQYLQIILPLWLAAMSARRAASFTHPTQTQWPQHAQQTQQAQWSQQTQQAQWSQQTQYGQWPQQTPLPTDEPPTPTGPGGTLVSREDIQELSLRISELSNVSHSDNRSLIENIRQRLDQSLLKCWIKLGLPVEEIELFTGIPATTRRMSNLHFETAPTTIKLDTAPEKHKKLELERVHVMARDDQTRILLYQSQDLSIQLTHIIPRGSIPWSPHKESRSVSFLTPHTITVVDEDGHHLYHIVPKYRFHESTHCKRFQETFRERELLGTPHEPVDITSGGDTVARRQVVKFWRRDSTQEVTVTFLASSTGDHHTHWELNVREYHAEAVYVLPRIARRTQSETVKIRSRHGEPSIYFKFESVEDAKAFKDMYQEVHPSNVPPPRLNTLDATPDRVDSVFATH